MRKPRKDKEPKDDFEYVVSDFHALNAYVDGIVERDGIYSKSKRADLYRQYAIVGSIVAISAAIVILLLLIGYKLYYGKSIFSSNKSQDTIVEYVRVPDPGKSQVIEKPIIIEKPIFIPVEIPSKKGVVTDFTIFQTVSLNGENVGVVVTGAKYASSDSRFPSHQWCYANSAKKIGNSVVKIEVGNKQGRSPVEWESLTDEQARESGVTLSTFANLRRHCQFVESDNEIISDKLPEPVNPEEEPSVTTGTAFGVNSKGFFVTNYHVVSQCSKIAIRKDSEFYPVELRVDDADLDLAVLKVPSSLATSFVRFAEEIRTGQDAIALGYPLGDALGDDLKVTSGIISSMSGLEGDQNHLQFTAPIQPGNSGGPLMDKFNRLVGVNTAALVGEQFQNINFAIKGVIVQQFLAVNRVEFHIETKKAIVNVPDIVSMSEEYVVQVYCMNRINSHN